MLCEHPDALRHSGFRQARMGKRYNQLKLCLRASCDLKNIKFHGKSQKRKRKLSPQRRIAKVATRCLFVQIADNPNSDRAAYP